MQTKMKALFLTAALLLNIAGCRSAEPEDTKIGAGITLYKEQDVYLSEVFREVFGMVHAKDSAYTDLTLEMQDSSNDHTRQNEQIDRFLDLQYDVLCINPVDYTNIFTLIRKAKEAEIPVLFFGRAPVPEDLMLYDKAYYLGADWEEAARLQAEIVQKAYEKDVLSIDSDGDGVISYVILKGEGSDPNTDLYAEYVIKALEEYGFHLERIRGGSADSSREQAVNLMERWINQKDFYAELVLCNNDEMALGALDALKAHALDGIPVVGIGGIDEAVTAVEEGQLLGTVISDKYTYAKTLLDAIGAVGSGKDLTTVSKDSDGKYLWLSWEIYSK